MHVSRFFLLRALQAVFDLDEWRLFKEEQLRSKLQEHNLPTEGWQVEVKAVTQKGRNKKVKYMHKNYRMCRTLPDVLRALGCPPSS